MNHRYCPNCGQKLKKKVIKKQPNQYKRGVRSFVCEPCGYAEYDSNPREKDITEGLI